jgi:putative transposase
MHFEANHIYHIFNRGNNSQPIFFSRENYLFFLRKIKYYIPPHADILAWCLMPTHFHFMVFVHHIDAEFEGREPRNEGSSEQVNLSHPLTGLNSMTKRSLNDSFSILLRSYTRAIQKQNNITGSLFQHRTKAVCLSEVDGITPAWFQSQYGTIINIIDPEKEYPQVCFNYIHQNPVKSGLTRNPSDWEFSSYADIMGIRNGKLINRERIKKLGLQI